MIRYINGEIDRVRLMQLIIDRMGNISRAAKILHITIAEAQYYRSKGITKSRIGPVCAWLIRDQEGDLIYPHKGPVCYTKADYRKAGLLCKNCNGMGVLKWRNDQFNEDTLSKTDCLASSNPEQTTAK